MPSASARGVIRVVFAKNPPDAFTSCTNFPTMVPTVDCPFPGWLVEVVRMLADYLNLQVEPIIIGSTIGNVNWGHQYKPGEFGNSTHRHQHRGNWSGILGILEQGMADTVCTLYPYTEEKAQFFNFSHPVTGVRDIYIARPKRKSLSVSIWNAFFPYEPKLWYLLLFSLAIQCALATLVSNLEFRLNLRPNYSPLEKTWQYLRLQIRQATESQAPFLLQAGNLAFIFYALIQATLFTQLYTAVLLSALIRGENPHPWDNYNEMVRLIKDFEYSMVIDKHHLEKDNSFYETLSYQGMSHLRNLANALEKNPIHVMENISQALDIVERGGFILPTKQHSLAYQLSKERCELFYFEDDHNQMPTFFIFSRKSKMLRDWNRAIQNNQAFIRRTFEKYFFHDFNTGNVPNCKRKTAELEEAEEEAARAGNSARDASRSLDIVSTFGIFLIALIGFALAFLVFLCELLVHAKARRLNRKWRTRRALVMANPSWPTHLIAIASEMRARRLAHADSQSSEATDKHQLFMAPARLLYANAGPPRLNSTVGRSWWRQKNREPAVAELRRQRSIVSAVTLAAISMQNVEQNVEMELRQRPIGKADSSDWAMLANGNGGEAAGVGNGEARTAF